MTPTVPLLDGLTFPESPRWHDDRLWFVDMFGRRVMTVDLAGRAELIAEFDDLLAGLGFLPDGTPLVVLRRQRRIVRLDDGRVHADLSFLTQEAPGILNDMVVDSQGRAYVDLLRASATAKDAIVLVEPDGTSRLVVDGVSEPNGLAIVPSGDMLVVGLGLRGPDRSLVAYSIADDGSLAGGRTYATTSGEGIDGICLDAERAVWFATFTGRRFLRVRPGGEIAQSVSVSPRCATACVLGGPGRKTLFMTTARIPDNPQMGPEGNMDQSKGLIEITTVNVSGAGWP